MVGVLAWLLRLGFEGREPGFQRLHLRPQRHHEGVRFRLRSVFSSGSLSIALL